MCKSKVLRIINIMVFIALYYSLIVNAGEGLSANPNPIKAKETYDLFIKYVNEENWSNALKLCSNILKSEAKCYKSEKDYLLAHIPLEAISNKTNRTLMRATIIRKDSDKKIMYGFYYTNTNRTLKIWACFVECEDDTYVIKWKLEEDRSGYWVEPLIREP